jgi:hypothetical protein
LRQGFARSIVALVSIALLGGCTTTGRLWTGTTEPAEVLPQVRRGDRVLLVREGQDYNCPVTGFDTEYVYGCRDPVALRDIQEVRFRKRDGRSVLTLSDLRRGDQLEVTLRSGDTKRFTFVAVEGEVLGGEDVEVMLGEVDHATFRRNGMKPGAKKVLIVAATVVVVAGAAFVYFMARVLGGEEE